ncbi:RNA-directed DNA polymerase, eukaryota, reverse transcriptase zinc-binding domain protein [Tanacetum coccineum]|uniref:RNA-directed DNA polymerase, eukaryota, reverse transcriptase zinc-binding domain protein n=1 Tax=Tanacetum coccineum TaxID=301880 RepID=A0ABQ4XDS5_9ASTR
MDRLSFRANLLNRGVKITCARCVLCDMENEVETVEHCLCLCPKAKLVWSKVWSWWRISSTPGTSIRDISLGKVASFENKWIVRDKKTFSHLYNGFLFFGFSTDAPIQTVSGVDGFRTLGELKVFDNYISSVCLLRF